jgi:hypothetical protein
MVRYKLWSGDKIVEVNIYTTKWRMHAASIHYSKTGILTSTSHGTKGICARWWLTSHRPNKVVAVIMMSWDTLDISILSHELLHAAIHIWTYEEEEEGKQLSTQNDEELAYIHSDLVENLLSLFNKSDIKKLIKNH